MKYLKYFEKFGYTDEDDKLNFVYRKGDLVKILQSSIDNEDELKDFNSTDLYIIINVDKTDYEYPYEIEYPFGDEYESGTIFLKEDQLTTPTPEEIEDYKIKLIANKYNVI